MKSLCQVLLPLVLVCAAACASASRGTRCAPIDPELYLDYGGLYDECTVEQRARMTGTPRLEYPYTPPQNVACLVGVLRFIVDTLGRPIPESVEIVGGNDQHYVEVMLNYLPQVRYSPGRVHKRAVHQIVRWESRTPAYQINGGRIDPTIRMPC